MAELVCNVTKTGPGQIYHPAGGEGVATSGTDALMLSGNLNVTKEGIWAGSWNRWHPTGYPW